MIGPGTLERDRDGHFWVTRADHLLMLAGGGMPWRRADVEAQHGPLVQVTRKQMESMASAEALAMECATDVADGGPCWCGEHL